MKTNHLYLVIAALCLLGCANGRNVPDPGSSTIDLTPKDSQYQDVEPTSISYYIRFNDGNFSIVGGKLSNVKLSNFNMEMDSSRVKSGKHKLFQIQTFRVSGELISNIYLGLSLRLNRLLNDTVPENFDNIHIPGFNKKTEDNNFSAGFNYSLSYRIPFRAQKN